MFIRFWKILDLPKNTGWPKSIWGSTPAARRRVEKYFKRAKEAGMEAVKEEGISIFGRRIKLKTEYYDGKNLQE